MVRILVHAGYHKTGTTSLQHTLHNNRQALESHFLYYGQEDFQNAGAHARIYAQRPFPWRKRAFRDAFRNFLTTIPDGNNIVLSRETFAGGLPGHLDWRGRPLMGYYQTSRVLLPLIRREVLRRFPDAELTWMFTTRDREAWVSSIHGHLLRSIALQDDLDTFSARMSGLPSPADELRKISGKLKPHEILVAPLEEHGHKRMGPARVVLDHFGITGPERHALKPASVSNKGQNEGLRAQFLTLNRSGLTGMALKEAKEALLRR